ncbi:hypothetical protein KAR91_08720 [Candidatus Pacearchaeota archaeon]|nr:hypothetical protein [Candidatus Pacearchaeota archaeon]
MSIELVNQHDDKSCGAACMAMLTGEPYKDILNDASDYFLMSECLKKLRDCGFDAFVVIGTGYFAEDTILMAVPSLNVSGGMHWVVFDKGIVYDPQKGREGRQSYASKLSPLGVGELVVVRTKYADEYDKRLFDLTGLSRGKP